MLINHIDILRNTLNTVKKRHPFKLDAMVILPDHLHAMITLPNGDSDYSTRWMLIKQSFSRQMPKTEKINKSRETRSERGIWQRRYWEHLIRDDDDYEKHFNYIHYNPVKHGYVKQATEWKHSTIHQYSNEGLLNQHWSYIPDNTQEITYGENG